MINKHALRNALIPIVTVIGMQIPMLFGGTVIIEQVFSWPGLGLLTMTAITNRDYPVIMGTTIFLATIMVLMNVLVDVVYTIIDPRIKLK